METKTLSKKQQKSSLAAKKIRTKVTIKNVIASPFKNTYWPEVQSEDYNTLEKILEDNLPRLQPASTKIPWAEIKEKLKPIPKKERAEFRSEYIKNHRNDLCDVTKKNREGLVLGINEVTKLLERNAASVVVISGDVQPRLMVQHVIDQCILYKVPILVFNNMKSLLKRVIGVSSAVMGIKKEVSLDSKLNLIKETIERIFEKCPAPVHHINYNRSLDVQPDVDLCKKKNGFQNEKERLNEGVTNVIDEEEIKNKLYLRRENENSRVFIPNYVEEKHKIIEIDTTATLSFSEVSLPVTKKIKTEQKPRYKSLVVKRLKGNPNRNKKKIDCIKSKKKK